MTFNIRWPHCIPMIVVMGIIFFLSHQPGAALQLSLPPGSDKLGHAVLYAVLAGTVILALVPARRWGSARAAGMLVLLFCSLYGISDEFHQAFIPGRVSSVGDLLADTVGAGAVVAVWLRFSATRQIKKN